MGNELWDQSYMGAEIELGRQEGRRHGGSQRGVQEILGKDSIAGEDKKGGGWVSRGKMLYRKCITHYTVIPERNFPPRK